MSVQFTIAGTGPVHCARERKIVNFNLSHIVSFFDITIYFIRLDMTDVGDLKSLHINHS